VAIIRGGGQSDDVSDLHDAGPARGDAVRADVGDWHYSHKGLDIRVPRGLSDEETLLLMVHELVESFMVRRDGVHEAAVNAFDQAHADADEALRGPAAAVSLQRGRH
jgi:hypothetical protein